MNSVATSLSTHGVAHQVFSGSEANSRYPQQLNLPENYKCVFEEDGGILRASKAVAALQARHSLYGSEPYWANSPNTAWVCCMVFEFFKYVYYTCMQ